MLLNDTLQRLRELRLAGMASALEEQLIRHPHRNLDLTLRVRPEKPQVFHFDGMLVADLARDARNRFGCPDRARGVPGLSRSIPSSAVAKRLL